MTVTLVEQVCLAERATPAMLDYLAVPVTEEPMVHLERPVLLLGSLVELVNLAGPATAELVTQDSGVRPHYPVQLDSQETQETPRH